MIIGYQYRDSPVTIYSVCDKPHSAPKKNLEPMRRRSNKPLTAFACSAIDDVVYGRRTPGTERNHNTIVAYEETTRDRILAVFLHETKLLELVFDKQGQPTHISISIGDRFTSEGYPSETVAERLNGMLDALGRHGILPDGVRVFKDREENTFYLGRGDDRLAVGQRFARNVVIEPNADNLIILASDIDFNA